MRSSIPFDTHAFVKELIAAGVPEAQAEVHARVLGEMVVEHFATKDDIARVREDIDRVREDIGRVREDIGRVRDGLRAYATKEDLKDLELRLTLRFGAMLAAAVAVIAALVKLL